MTENDLAEFTALLDSVSAMLSRGQYMPNDISSGIFFRVLSQHPIESVRAAFEAHVRTCRFVPTPADILALLSESDGRPGAEEAWALVLRDREDDATHERLTTVWTREMLVAWGFARQVLAGGDEVGARMAFREAYNREVEQARRRCEPVRWEVSLGSDKAAAAEVVRAALADGRIKLPALGSPGDEVTLLLESASMPRRLALPAPERDDSPVAIAAKERLKLAVAALVNPDRVSADSQAKVETSDAAAASRQRVAAYAAEHGIELGGGGR